MATYEFQCVASCGVFEKEFRIADMPQETPCECGAVGKKILSLFGNISTSDDPSFGSSRNGRKNREFSGFDENAFGWTDKVTPNKSWEYE